MNSPQSTSSSPPSAPLSQLLAQAADAVQAVRGGRSLTDVLARVPANLRPGTQALSFHVLRHLGAAEAARALLAPKAPPPKVDGLLVSAIALLWPVTGATPPYAEHTVVDQAVAAVRKRAPNSAGFVNAVLRRFLREREATVAAVTAAQPRAAWNHPDWWIAQLQADWPEHWQQILRANNEHPPMSLRADAAGTANAYLQRLAEAGIAARAAGPLAPRGVVLERAVPVAALPGFAAGEVSVQDVAAQLAAPLLLEQGPQRPPEGARVLDACSAPGGKTAHLLQLRQDLDLLALDADGKRLARVQENLDRLGRRATLKAADARDTAAWWDGKPFDAILLDAPCSASGIVRRHPDVRWLRRAEDIGNLARLQAELLDALWATLKPGGLLVYATCSIFKAEGVDQIDAFLQRQNGASRLEVDGVTGHLLPLADNGPSLLDGFFYALLQKS